MPVPFLPPLCHALRDIRTPQNDGAVGSHCADYDVSVCDTLRVGVTPCRAVPGMGCRRDLAVVSRCRYEGLPQRYWRERLQQQQQQQQRQRGSRGDTHADNSSLPTLLSAATSLMRTAPRLATALDRALYVEHPMRAGGSGFCAEWCRAMNCKDAMSHGRNCRLSLTGPGHSDLSRAFSELTQGVAWDSPES